MTTQLTGPSRPEVRHVLVDRDGVLNVEADQGWVVDRAGWHWERGALDALDRLAGAGVGVSVVTNQSCIGRQVATAPQVAALHDQVVAEVRGQCGLDVRVYVCPHTDQDGCDCRKPAPGLLLRAMAEQDLDPATTLMVGDADRDLEAGRRAGVATALVRTGKGGSVDPVRHGAVAEAADLLGLVELLLDGSGPAVDDDREAVR